MRAYEPIPGLEPLPLRGPDLVRGAELKDFTATLMQALMSDYRIAGAAVAIVKDGEPVLLEGYGTADARRGVDAAVDPHQTLFRIGSTSKLVTATAALQLVDAGRLALDADVNEYLPFRVPA